MSKVLKAQQMSLTPQAYAVPVAPIRVQHEEEAHPDPAWEAMRLATLAEADAIREQAQADAKGMLEEAQATAAGLLENERARVQAQLAEEVEAAKQAGYAEGLQQARQMIEAEYAERFAQIEQIFRLAQEERRSYLAESESMIVDLACEVARKIMMQDSVQERDWVLNVVRHALEEINDAGKIEVRVHPEDFERVNQNRESLRIEVPGQSELLVLPDRGVGVGGCVVHTSFGNIDARIDTQLEEVRKALQEVAATLEP